MLLSEMNRWASLGLAAVLGLSAGCGAESEPPLPKSSEELQALVEQEDAAVRELELQQQSAQ